MLDLEARSKQCRDLSKDKGQGTLMPVRPKGRPTSEGLSCNGETAEGEDQEMAGDEAAQDGGCVLPDAASQTEEGQAERDSADEDQEEEDEEGGEEGRMSVGRSSPKDPTRKQREDHERTHMPYRSWCEDCVRSRARNAPHHKKGTRRPPRGD